MQQIPHGLAEDFPGHVDRLHELRRWDTHFARLVERYHDVNRAVGRSESNIEPMDDLAESELRKLRVALKDSIWQALKTEQDQPIK